MAHISKWFFVFWYRCTGTLQYIVYLQNSWAEAGGLNKKLERKGLVIDKIKVDTPFERERERDEESERKDQLAKVGENECINWFWNAKHLKMGGIKTTVDGCSTKYHETKVVK